MKAHRLISLLLLVGLLGCHRVPQLKTFSQISMTDKMVADVRVTGVQLEPKVRVSKTLIEGKESALTIAVVDIDGLLLNENFTGLLSEGENPVNFFAERLEAIKRDPRVRGVVVRINTPGGGVTASDIMHQELLAFKQRTGLPIVACIMDLGTGGGYYLACAGDHIVAHPTSVIGGVGVIMNLFNLSDFLGAGNVFAQPVRSGSKIDLGTLLREIAPEDRQLLQGMADEFHLRFKRLVTSSRRGVNASDATNFDGRVFTSNEALRRGFVDEVGYLENAIRGAAKRAGLGNGYAVAMYHRPTDTPHSPYAITPNIPMQSSFMPVSVPGLDRSRLPRFLYLWQTDPSLESVAAQ